MGYLGGVAGLEQLEGGCVRAPEVGGGLIEGGPRMKCVASCPKRTLWARVGTMWGRDRLGGIAERVEDILWAPLGELESGKRHFGCLKELEFQYERFEDVR